MIFNYKLNENDELDSVYLEENIKKFCNEVVVPYVKGEYLRNKKYICAGDTISFNIQFE